MVFQTTEYDRFRMILGNRQLNERKIKRIITEIEGGVDLLEYYPIQVSEKNKVLEIIDGQHRFYICRKLKKPVFYIVLKKEVGLPDIAKVNSNVEKWKGADFINCFSQLDNENYIKLRDVMDKYPVPLTTAIGMLQAGRVNEGGSANGNFENGVFVIKHYDFAMKVFEYCSQFKFPRKFSRSFITAITRVMAANKITVEDLIERCNTNADDMIISNHWKEYLTNMENIFNKGKKNRIVIY
jgi:hypothetical protein